MRGMLGLFLALALLAIGVALFNEGISKSDLSQTTQIISGAGFLSVGLTGLWFTARNWLKWRKEYKEYRNE